MKAKKWNLERWAVVDQRGTLVVLFERANTTEMWANWVATGKRGRRAIRVRITEIGRGTKATKAKRAQSTRRSAAHTKSSLQY